MVEEEEERRTGLSIITQHRSPPVPSTTFTSPPILGLYRPPLCVGGGPSLCARERDGGMRKRPRRGGRVQLSDGGGLPSSFVRSL